MKKILLIFSFLQSAFILTAQTPNFIWANQVLDGGSSITLDALGNVYMTGAFQGTVDFDPGPAVFNLSSAGSTDIVIQKLDASGNFIWARNLGGSEADGSISVVVDVLGNVLTTGWFMGTADFDPGAASFNLTSAGDRDIFISKLNASGNFVWAKRMGGSQFDWGRSITVDASGNVYTTGEFDEVVDFDPGPGIYNLNNAGIHEIFIQKLDASGNFVWAKSQGGVSGDYSFCIKLDASGNVYTAGHFDDTADFDPGPAIYNLNGAGIFVSKLNNAGNFVWAKHMGEYWSDLAYSLALDATGNVYVTGIFTFTKDFDPGPGIFNLTSFGDWDIFILKLDTSGNFIWAKQIGGTAFDECHSIAVDGVGNTYLTGNIRGTTDFDPGPGVFNLTTAGEGDIFICQLTTSGNFGWAVRMGGPLFDGGSEIAVNTAGIYTTGGFIGTVDFDPGLGIYNLTSLSSSFGDCYVHKMSRCTASTSSLIITECKDYTLNGVTYTASGVYTQTILNTAGCDSIITLNLTISKIKTEMTVSSCNNYTWNGNTYFSSGDYNDTLTTASGCDSILTLHLTINSTPAPYLGTDTSLCAGQLLQLYPGSFTTYTWQDGSTQNYFIAKQPGLYSVDVSNSCGSARDEIIIKGKACNIYFPNAFTPNNDGNNDEFKMLGAQNISDYHLIVYNRYGEKVFETTDPASGWTGKYKDKLHGPGVYIWQCDFIRSGFTNHIKGTVVLVR